MAWVYVGRLRYHKKSVKLLHRFLVCRKNCICLPPLPLNHLDNRLRSRLQPSGFELCFPTPIHRSANGRGGVGRALWGARFWLPFFFPGLISLKKYYYWSSYYRKSASMVYQHDLCERVLLTPWSWYWEAHRKPKAKGMSVRIWKFGAGSRIWREDWKPLPTSRWTYLKQGVLQRVRHDMR